LVEQGFIDFVLKAGKGPLFYSTERQKEGVSGQNPTYARVGQSIAEWVRGLGIDDPDVSPNHGWRHRFKTMGRRCGMDSAKLDAIQGHAQANEGGRYKVVAAETTDRRRTRRSKERTSNP
jgi:integrase